MDKDILLITDFFKFIPFYFLLLYPFGAYKKEQAWRIPVGLFFLFFRPLSDYSFLPFCKRSFRK